MPRFKAIAKTVKLSGIGLLMFTTLGAFSKAQSQTVPAAQQWLWDASRGFVPAQQCERVSHPETEFQIVQYTGAGDEPYENLRTHAGAVQNYLINRSLVRFIDGSAKPNYHYVQVIGVSQTPGLSSNRWFAEALDEGYIHKNSFRRLSEYVFEIKEGAPAEALGEVPLVGSFWQAKMQGEQFQYFRCSGRDYLIFDVHVPGSAGAVYQVGVNADMPSILTSIRSYTNQEAESAIQPGEENLDEASERTAETSDANGVYPLTTSAVGIVAYGTQPSQMSNLAPSSETTPQANVRDETGVTSAETSVSAVPSTSTANTEDADSGATHEVESTVEPTEDHPPTSESEWETIQQVIEAEGIPSGENDGLHKIVCTDGATLNVRPQGDADSVLFKANPYEEVIVSQAFEEDESFTTEIGGETYKFIKVLFPGRTDEAEKFGWVAESYVTFESHCPSFQRSLGSEQPIVCINSGEMNVRDESLNSDDILFRANQFEPVAFFNESESRKKSTSVNGRVLEFVPVVFPERGNREGWIASDYVKTKAQCAPFKAGGCCKFPTAQYPTQTYTNPGIMASFDYIRDGGGRRHAACDLYRNRGDAAVAVSKGVIIRELYEFYSNTFAIDVKHDDFIARYGEMLGSKASGTRQGSTVRTGHPLGYIARIGSLNPMLHFEMYSDTSKTDTASGREKLTQRGGKYSRRSDLMNPTSHLQKWELKTFGRSH